MNFNKKKIITSILSIILIFAIGFGGGYAGYYFASSSSPEGKTEIIKTSATDKPTTDISQIAQSASDCVVEITTESVTRGGFMNQYVSKGAGSGVILTTDGYIITNYHVIDGASTYKVATKDGSEYDAEYIGGNADNDIAVLKIDAKGLSVAAVGDSDQLEIGDLAVAIGNPLGTLGGTVTEGIISATSREIDIDGTTMTLLQTSAAINPGNSGGGLFNSNGELIGIVNAKSSGEDIEGLGFAIPINTAIDIAEQIIDKGFADGGFTIGVTLVELNTEKALTQYNVDEEGVYIYEVRENSIAENVGLKAKDRIVSINGKEIETSQDAIKIIKNSEKGDTIKMIVNRNGKDKTITIEV